MKLIHTSEIVRRTLDRIWFTGPAKERIASLGPKKRDSLHYLILSGCESSSLGLDRLEDRIALTAGIEIPIVVAGEPPSAAEVSSPDPSSIPVYAGPGDNSVISIIDPALIGSDPDPSTIPVFAGPGDNDVISIEPSVDNLIDPSAVPVFAGPGDNAVIAQEATTKGVYSVTPIGQTPLTIPAAPINAPVSAAPLEVPLSPPATNDASAGLPELTDSSRVTTGTAPPGTRAPSGAWDSPPSSLIPVVDGLLMEEERVIGEMEKLLAQLPIDESGTNAIDQAVEGDWLFHELRDLLSKEMIVHDESGAEGVPVHSTSKQPSFQEDGSPEPLLLFQIGSLGVLGAALMATSLIPSRNSTAGSRRRKHPRENMLRSESEEEIEITTEESSGYPVQGRIRDVSVGGMGIIHRGPLPAKTLRIRVQGEESTKLGTVRWTRRLRGNLFASGIRLDSAEPLDC